MASILKGALPLPLFLMSLNRALSNAHGRSDTGGPDLDLN